jgi:hypothetical protein
MASEDGKEILWQTLQRILPCWHDLIQRGQGTGEQRKLLTLSDRNEMENSRRSLQSKRTANMWK